MPNNLLRRGNGDLMNKTIEDLFKMTLDDFGTTGIIRVTENNAKIVAGGEQSYSRHKRCTVFYG